MKILHIVDSGGMYGKEHVILNLAKEQHDAGHPVTLHVLGKRDLVNEARKLGIYAYHIANKYALLSSNASTLNYYDIIHVHDYVGSVLLSIQKVAKTFNTPIVRTVHGYTSANKPWYAKIRLYEALERISYWFHAAVVGVSENMKDFYGVGSVINNGINPVNGMDMSNIPSEFWNQQSDNLQVMCTARLSKEKNLDNLIRAIKILTQRKEELPKYGLPPRGIKLYIFGDGPERQHLEQLIEQLDLTPGTNAAENVYKLDEVYLMRFQPYVRAFLKIVDIYIQPSYTEGTPISVLEAMDARCPIITSYVGGMKILVDKGAASQCELTPEEIAFAIIKQDKNSYITHVLHEQTRAAYMLFKTEYTNKVMSKRYLDVYNQCVK